MQPAGRSPNGERRTYQAGEPEQDADHDVGRVVEAAVDAGEADDNRQDPRDEGARDPGERVARATNDDEGDSCVQHRCRRGMARRKARRRRGRIEPGNIWTRPGDHERDRKEHRDLEHQCEREKCGRCAGVWSS